MQWAEGEAGLFGRHGPGADQMNKAADVMPHRGVSLQSSRSSAPAGRASRLADAAVFLRGFLARPLEIASVAPSSVFLEARVVQAADLAQARCVVELGPGTGGTTRALLRALAPHARLLAIEVNPGFCSRLRRLIDDPRLEVHAASAETLADALRLRGLPAPDVVVSGIPFSTLPRDLAQRIAAAIPANLAPGGRVVAYQCRSHVTGYLAPHFGPPRTAWEWRSLPPIRVFVWVKPTAGTGTQRPLVAHTAKLIGLQGGAENESQHASGDQAQVGQSRLLRVPSGGLGGDADHAGPYACLRTGPAPGGTRTSVQRPEDDTSGPCQR
jgi:phosphatidylethanolamine/phosphatidyl-N-methylethanolamine N-methyltransferase